MGGCGTAVRLRKQHGLEASGCKLCMAHCFCCCCAMTQELRLVKMVREARQQALEQWAPVRQTMAPVTVMVPAEQTVVAPPSAISETLSRRDWWNFSEHP